MKAYTTDIEQSRKLIEILPPESADMCYPLPYEDGDKPLLEQGGFGSTPCWSLTALLEYLKNINSTVYIPMLYVHDNKWMLQLVERGHGNVAEVECDNPVDTCYEMIIKLHEQKLL